MNDEEVILNVGSTKFLLSVSEAMEVAKVLNSCQTIGSKWLKNGSVTCVQKPSNDVCFVTPMTGIFRMELDSNQREIEAENKK
jgi:hypothetical protein